MGSQWENFLANLGEWRGSFTALNAEGEQGESTASILSLEQGQEERLVHFRLRRFGPGDASGVPSREINQEYRSLGRQVVFFDSGSFSKVSLQVAPGTAFGAEFGFIAGDRRHRRALAGVSHQLGPCPARWQLSAHDAAAGLRARCAQGGG